MDSRWKMVFSLISGTIIVLVSVFVAYVCFNLLESSAVADLKGWKLGGAFAGFVFTFSILTSATFQFYKHITADQTEKYRQQIQELQLKLIKGAPCPPGYEIDLDERHRLVFARPNGWTPSGGFLFQYVNNVEGDILNANFNVVYHSIDDLITMYKGWGLGKFDPDHVDLDLLYKKIIDTTIDFVRMNFPAYEEGTISNETVSLDSYKSIKSTHLYSYTPPERTKIRMSQACIFTYVPRMKALYQFTFSDNEEDYLKSSEIFNTVVSSIRFL